MALPPHDADEALTRNARPSAAGHKAKGVARNCLGGQCAGSAMPAAVPMTDRLRFTYTLRGWCGSSTWPQVLSLPQVGICTAWTLIRSEVL